MLLISFPHNPTTTCVDLAFLTEIVELARSHGTLIVHDFAYADLGFDGYMPPSILEVPGAKDIAVEIFSMSKSFNMAGWRVGFCLGNAKMIAALARIKSYLDYGVFQPIQIASIVALRECEDESVKICEVYQQAPRRAGGRALPRRLAGAGTEGDDVPVGAAAGALTRASARWNFRSC